MESTSIQNEVEKALQVIESGGIIIYPTDTIWGIGCDSSNEEAVQKIFKLKKRADSKSMICLISDERMLYQHVNQVPEVAWDLMEYSDKPLTLIYDEAKNLAPGLIAEDGSAALRVCKHDFCQALIRKMRKPLVSTSANVSGEASPRSFKEIDPRILEGADYVVNLHRQKGGEAKASTIIRLKLNGEVKVIRP